jgi:hypothetical protein
MAAVGTAILGQEPKQASTFVSDSINSGLPPWLRFGAEERVRGEYLQGEAFKAVGNGYLLNRLRLRMDVRTLPWLTFSFQAEDARVSGQNLLPAPATQKDAMDLRLGYVQLGGEEGVALLRVGRQSLDFGEGRLLADPNWSNVGRTFDAARITLRHGLTKLDLFGGAAVKIDPTSFDRAAAGQRFQGAYVTSRELVPNASIEPYLFWRLEPGVKNESGRLGDLDEKVMGLRWAGKLPLRFDYSFEAAVETGSWAGDHIAAWMGHWLVGRTLSDSWRLPRLFFEFNRASGDAAARDGKRGTFDPLFPSTHDKYGLSDLFGSSNIVYLRPGLQVLLRRNLSIGLAYNDYWLASVHDALYVAGKPLLLRPDAGRHIGQEADVQSQWVLSRTTQVTVGLSRLFPAEYLHRATAGTPYNAAFCNVSQRF